MSPSLTQSIENYEYFSPIIYKELESKNHYLKITKVILLDEFYKRNLINKTFYKQKLKIYLVLDKREECKELFQSMLLSSFILFICFLYFPKNYLFMDLSFVFYLFAVFYIASMYYRKLV
jgi:hypothetical protein